MPDNLGSLHERYPLLYALNYVFRWTASKVGALLSVIFATWPSMYDPIKYLLNVEDPQKADELTERWYKAKLKELQFVGLTSALVTGTIAAAFSWYSIEQDPWSTEACWTSALVMALTSISLATQQTIGLSRLCTCEDGWVKVRKLLGERDPAYKRASKHTILNVPRQSTESRVRMKKSQLWMWQTPVMLSNFSILFFVVGLMISIFVRAARSPGNWYNDSSQGAIFFGCVAIFTGANYLFCWICLNRGSMEPKSNPEPREFHGKAESNF